MATSAARPGLVRWRRLGAVVGVAALALAGACSSGGGSGSTATRRFSAYRQCLQQHGVTPRRGRGSTTTSAASPATTPGTSAGSSTTRSTTAADAAAFSVAREACRKLRPAGGLRNGGIAAKSRSAFRKCMSDHGVTLPTPTTTPGVTLATPAPRGGMLAGLDRHDPKVSAALSACRSLLGAPRASTTTTH